MLRRMKSNIEKASKHKEHKINFLSRNILKDVPGSPREVQLTVTSAQSLSVKFFEPESNNGAVVTRYRSEYN